ncbi:unnamed protein product, partial [Discosporangium mesarthrocarpum]
MNSEGFFHCMLSSPLSQGIQRKPLETAMACSGRNGHYSFGTRYARRRAAHVGFALTAAIALGSLGYAPVTEAFRGAGLRGLARYPWGVGVPCGGRAVQSRVAEGEYKGTSARVKVSRRHRCPPGLNMGVGEWQASGKGGETKELCFLPFVVEDVMCPGETKELHLFEARFLALFERAMKEHGGCIGGAIIIPGDNDEEGGMVKVGHLCEIMKWEREEVGVSATLRCIGRVELIDLVGLDPYISAMVRMITDSLGSERGSTEGGEDAGALQSDIFVLYEECMELQAKIAGQREAEAGGGVSFNSLLKDYAPSSPESPSVGGVG